MATEMFPQGDGHPDCPQCLGRGVVELPPEEWHPLAITPQTRICHCVYVRDVVANMERGCKGLSKLVSLPSPLVGKEQENLRITSPYKMFKQHLRYVVSKKEPRWYFAVVSDLDLMTAWLHHVSTDDLYDADVGENREGPRPTDKFSALVDIAEPPELLILRVGVKNARNKAMPEVLLEALHHREHLGKPTWVVDAPNERLDNDHISWSPAVGEFLADWEWVELDASEHSPPPTKSFVGGSPTQPTGGTRSVLEAEVVKSKGDNGYRPRKKKENSF